MKLKEGKHFLGAPKALTNLDSLGKGGGAVVTVNHQKERCACGVEVAKRMPPPQGREGARKWGEKAAN